MNKALLIASGFFGYYRDIAAELNLRGYSVDYVPDRPSESTMFKSLGRINYGIVQKRISSYCSELCRQLTETEYDLVLFVGGMSICFDRTQMELLRNASKARFALYLWDALGNCQRVGSYLDMFDAVFSFEPSDCLGNSIQFLPLFYARDYAQVPLYPDGGFEYDACFVGSVHQVSKFTHIQQMVDELKKDGARVYCHYFMPSKSVAKLRVLTHPVYRNVDLRFDALNRSEILSLYSRSRVVIDSPQSGQTGLTMRTIETLGAKRKLLTTNCAVEDYDFFEYGNVYAYREGERIESEFVLSNPSPLPEHVYEKYSITNWLASILSELERRRL